MTAEQSREVPLRALGVGGGLGVVAAAVVTGSVVLVLVLFLGAVIGAVVVGMGWLVAERFNGRSTSSGDHPPPGFRAGGGAAKQRAEAGHTSPSSP